MDRRGGLDPERRVRIIFAQLADAVISLRREHDCIHHNFEGLVSAVDLPPGASQYREMISDSLAGAQADIGILLCLAPELSYYLDPPREVEPVRIVKRIIA